MAFPTLWSWLLERSKSPRGAKRGKASCRDRRAARRPEGARLRLEHLEDRLAPAVVNYNATTALLSFTADVGDADNVSVTSPAANTVRIVVVGGDTISLTGDVGTGFTLSDANRQLDINTATAPLAQFNVNLGDMNDVLALGPLTTSGNLTADSDTITLGGTVTAGNVSLTAVNSLVDGADDDVADIVGGVVTLNVTGAGNTIGVSPANSLEIDAATRLDATTNNGLVVLKNVAGNLSLGTLNAGSAFIMLTARNGAIADGNGGAGPANLTAASGVSLRTSGTNSAIGTAALPIRTAIGALTATTYDGGIFVADSNGPGLIINAVLAQEGGQTPIIDGSNRVVVFDPLPATTNPHAGVHDVSITAQGPVLLGTVTAPDAVTITSVTGGILDINQASINVLARNANLVAQGAAAGSAVGHAGDTIESAVETFSASTANGGIFLAQGIDGTAVSVVAGGAGNDVWVTSAATTLRVKVISALGDVTVASNGGSLVDDNGAAVNVTGQVLNLTGKSGIGTAADPFETTAAQLRATASDSAAVIRINETDGLTSVTATTNAGDVTINFTGGALAYVASSGVLSASGAAVTFETTGGDVKLGLVEAGSVSITASGAITDDVNDAVVDLRGGTVIVKAGTGIGTLGNEIDTEVATLDATTTTGNIFIREANALVLSAASNGFTDPSSMAGSDIDVRSSTGNMTLGLVSGFGSVILGAGGAILDGNGVETNLSAGTLALTASNGIGSSSDGLEASVDSLTAAGGSSGGLFLANDKALTLTSATAGGASSVSATGNLTLGTVSATGQAVTLIATEQLIDGNGAALNVTAASATLNGSVVGSSSDRIETKAGSITAATTAGGIFITDSGTGSLTLAATALGQSANVDVDSAGNIVLSTATAQGDTVKIRAAGLITDGNDTPTTTLVNIIAKTLDVAAPGGIGTPANPLETDVDQVETADGGAGGASLTNAGTLALTEAALEASGIGTLTFDAESITVFDIADNTAGIAPGRSLVLRTQTGPIVFMDAEDTLQTSGAGTITVQAGTIAGSGGVAVLGNLRTSGGNILVVADRTITIGRLDAGTGDVTVRSFRGIIIDGNGPALNVIAGTTTLSGAAPTARAAELDEIFRIAEAAAASAEAAAKLTSADAFVSGKVIMEGAELEADAATKTAQQVYDSAKAKKDAEAAVLLGLKITKIPVQATKLGLDIAKLFADSIAAAAQAIPLTGDLGAAGVKDVIDKAKAVVDGILLALDIAILAQTEVYNAANGAANRVQAQLFAAKSTLKLATATADAFAESSSIATAAAEEAAILRDALARVRDQAILAREQLNVLGTPVAPLGLQVAGVINVAAGPTDSHLQVVGATALDLINTTGSVTLISTGAISDTADGSGADVLATGLRIVAVGGVGTAADPVETRVATLNAANTSGGDIAIANTAGAPAALDITGVSNAGGGDIIVSNQGSTAAGLGITVSGPISATGAGADVTVHSGSPMIIAADVTAAGAILLEAGETPLSGDDLTVNPGVTIRSTGSGVTLRAGDNVLFSAGATIQASTTITLTAAFGAADAAGAVVTVAGTLIAPSALIGVDPAADGDDTFTITPSATTPITADAEDGADTLYFRADGLPVTIVGNQITALGRAPVTFLNFEFVKILNANGGGSVTLLAQAGAADILILTGIGQGAGTFTLNGGIPISFGGVTSFTFNAGDMDDAASVSPFATSVLPWNVAVAIDGGAGTDRIIYDNVAGLLDGTSVTATAAQAGHIDSPGVTSALNGQLVTFWGVEGVAANANPGEDEKLTVNLRDTAAPDTANLLFNPAPGADDLQLVGLFDLDIDTDHYVGLTLNGRGGDDTFNVTPGAIPVFVDGGDPVGATAGDAINFNPPAAYALEPGPHSDQGGLTAAGAQRVSWAHIEALSVTGGGPGTVLGTNGNDAITVVTLNATDFTVSVNDGPAVLFLGQDAITVDARAGDDTVVVQTPGAQAVTYTPAGVGAATIDVGTLSMVTTTAGAEHVVYLGLGGDTLTMNGTSVDDNFVVNPTSGGSGSHRSNLAPTFDYTGATDVTVTGGTGGFDVLAVVGSEGADTVTSAANVLTVAGQGTATVGANLDRIDVTTLGGNDSVNMASLTLPTIIRGGDGDDILVGSPQADVIFGGAGNDVLIGGAGADQEYGEAGDDRFGDLLSTGNGVADDAGADFLFGGDGTDEFVWEPGDGSDLVEGGDGADVLRFFGSDALADTFNLRPAAAAPTHLNVVLGAATVDTSGVEQVIVTGRTGGDTFTAADLTSTEVEHVVLDVTAGDSDNVTVNGRATDDNLLISAPGAGTVNVLGLKYDVRLLNVTTADGLTVLGNEGDDTIKANAGVENTVLITLDGGAGNDTLSADGTLIGGPGDDSLEGGAGANQLFGGDGEDTMVGGPGNDTFDGGPGFDTILIRGTSANDVVDVFQNAPGAAANSGYVLDWSLNGVARQDAITQDTAGSPGAAGTRPTVEEVRVEAGLGNDLIRVGVSDAYSDLDPNNGVPNQPVRFNVLGDAPNSGDRLLVRDDGLGDLVVLRQGPDGRSGRVSVAPGATIPDGGTGLADVIYQGIARLDITPLSPVSGGAGTDGNGRILVFQADPFEFNDSRFNAGQLARVGQSSTSPNIGVGGMTTPFDVNGDEDWYEFRPSKTDTFQIKILFDKIATLANGRPGLPGDGDLSLDIYDANGALITSGVADAGGNNRTATFGATDDPALPQFNRIFVRVKGAGAQPSLSINRYDFDNLSGAGSGIPGSSAVDSFGPRVTGVNITEDALTSREESAYNLFDPKPTAGPTPLVPGMVVHFVDYPARAPGALYPALDADLFSGPAGRKLAMGLFSVVGDRVGNVPILDVVLTNDPVTLGQPATATVTIIFDLSSPVFAQGLPDDRFTLTILDGLSDPAGARLDGESAAAQPKSVPSFPSGNGQAGGDFHARFTVDSRPEMGTYSFGAAYVDINGSGTFDPQNTNNDGTDRDIAFVFGNRGDQLFAGNFAPASATSASGFDKVAAFGQGGASGPYRFLFDFDHDGVADLNVTSMVNGNGAVAVAGNFAPGHPGDEVGLFNGLKWFLDSNGNNVLGDAGDVVLSGNMRGLPIVGDFDGDGKDDLATYKDGVFSFDPAFNGLTGNAEVTINFGFFGPFEQPVAADLNLDGTDDIGLFLPERNGSPPSEVAEWFWLVSTGTPVAGSVTTLNHPFRPVPFGNDRFFQFGDQLAKPLVGNFDPPVTGVPDGPSGEAGNRAPVAHPDTVTLLEDAAAVVLDQFLITNDTDPDGDPRALTDVSPSRLGTVRVDNNRFVFTPARNATGTETLMYTIIDGRGGKAWGTVTINLNGVNDAPVNTLPVTTRWRPLRVHTNRPVALTGRFAVRVADVDSARVRVTLTATNGLLRLTRTAKPVAALTLTSAPATVNRLLANLTFLPKPGFVGKATVRVTTSDLGGAGAGGARTDTDTIHFLVTGARPMQSKAFASATAYVVRRNTPLSVPARGGLQRAFIDADKDVLRIRLAVGQRPVPGLALKPDGSFRYVPLKGVKGKVTFKVQAFDGDLLSAPLTVTLTVL